MFKLITLNLDEKGTPKKKKEKGTSNKLRLVHEKNKSRSSSLYAGLLHELLSSIVTPGISSCQLTPNWNPGKETGLLKVMVMVPVKTALALQYAVMNSVVSVMVPSAPPWIILQGQTRGEREGKSHRDSTPHGQFPVRQRAEGFPASRTRSFYQSVQSREVSAEQVQGKQALLSEVSHTSLEENELKAGEAPTPPSAPNSDEACIPFWAGVRGTRVV